MQQFQGVGHKHVCVEHRRYHVAMKAVAYQKSGPADVLVDVELPDPVASGRDVLVEVCAVSVNPIDCKVRTRAAPPSGEWKTLGWDVAGVVKSVGADVRSFAPGDKVWYAGSLERDGANAQLHLVDERLVARLPENLSFSAAAAMPLTSITAWEMLFDRLAVERAVPGAQEVVLIIGAAGGVGSVAVQLARQLTGLSVVATASRPQTVAWVQSLGAHHVVDHSQPLAPQFAEQGIAAPAFVFSIQSTHSYVEQIADLIAPQGRFGLIDDPDVFDLKLFKRKSVSVHWESMFTRSSFETVDMDEQGKLLTKLSVLVETGHIRSTLTDVAGPINAENLIAAHKRIESGTSRGKIVLEGF